MRRSSIFVALLCLTACSPRQQTVTIEFEARLGDVPIDCETEVGGIRMSDLRFYVYHPILTSEISRDTDSNDARSRNHYSEHLRPISLSDNGRWQQQELALIDLENGQGACENGTPDTNSKIVGTVPAGDYDGLEFEVGVPFTWNHADPLTAAPPLDDSTMHWHWRSGYKFMRAGFETDDDGFWMHVGSAGCEGTVGDISRCRFPNRVPVQLSDYRPGDTVIFDLSPLVDVVDTNDATPTDCSSGPAEDACREPFAVFGLEFDSGQPNYLEQLFRVEPQ